MQLLAKFLSTIRTISDHFSFIRNKDNEDNLDTKINELAMVYPDDFDQES